MTEPLLVERRGDVEWITLNRPDRLNAIDATMAEALAEFFLAMPARPDVRVIVLRGAGRGFCAGLDLKSGPPSGDAGGTARIPEVVLSMRRCPQPIVALVHGAACGGGLAFALAADIRIAGESARMNDAFITLGLSGCELGMSWFLPRYVGHSVAAELMFTGRFLTAERALRLGLVSDVVPDDQLEDAASRLVAEMLEATPLGLRRTKETLLKAMEVDDLEAVIRMEMATQIECARQPEFLDRVRAFSGGGHAS